MQTLAALQPNKGVAPTMQHHFIAGLAAGWASCLVATPIEQVKARLQVLVCCRACAAQLDPDPVSMRGAGSIRLANQSLHRAD